MHCFLNVRVVWTCVFVPLTVASHREGFLANNVIEWSVKYNMFYLDGARVEDCESLKDLETMNRTLRSFSQQCSKNLILI